MKLVYDWKQGWKWVSTWGLVVLAALPQVWNSLPPETQAMAPIWAEPWVFSAIAIGTLAGRFIDQ
jgi:hypothetical protein